MSFLVVGLMLGRSWRLENQLAPAGVMLNCSVLTVTLAELSLAKPEINLSSDPGWVVVNG